MSEFGNSNDSWDSDRNDHSQDDDDNNEDLDPIIHSECLEKLGQKDTEIRKLSTRARKLEKNLQSAHTTPDPEWLRAERRKILENCLAIGGAACFLTLVSGFVVGIAYERHRNQPEGKNDLKILPTHHNNGSSSFISQGSRLP